MAAPARPWSWSTADLGSPPCPKDLSASWLQGQGHNRDIDRPFSYEAFGDDMVLAEMAKVSRSGFEQMKQAPMYQAWLAVAPDVTAFPALMDKTGDPLRRPYDWSKEVRRIDIPTLLSTVTPTASRRHTPPKFFALRRLEGRRLGRLGPPRRPSWSTSHPATDFFERSPCLVVRIPIGRIVDDEAELGYGFQRYRRCPDAAPPLSPNAHRRPPSLVLVLR